MDVIVSYLESMRRVADLCTTKGDTNFRDQLRFWQGELRAVGNARAISCSLMRLVPHGDLRHACEGMSRASVQTQRGRRASTQPAVQAFVYQLR